MNCSEETTMNDEDDNEETIKQPSQEVMLKALRYNKKGLHSQESATDEVFQSLQNFEHFYEQCVFYK